MFKILPLTQSAVSVQ